MGIFIHKTDLVKTNPNFFIIEQTPILLQYDEVVKSGPVFTSPRWSNEVKTGENRTKFL